MRILLFCFSLAITIVLIVMLDTKKILPAPLGKLLSPQEGLWQNAEPADQNFSEDLRFPNLTGKVEVFIDERLVPHIFADHDVDAAFVRGSNSDRRGGAVATNPLHERQHRHTARAASGALDKQFVHRPCGRRG